MKKLLLGTIALFIALSITAFAVVKQKEAVKSTDYYWFEVLSGYGSENTFNNDEAVFISGITQPSSVVPNPDCPPPGLYKCVIGFSRNQLMDDDITLINTSGGDVAPVNPGARSRETQ